MITIRALNTLLIFAILQASCGIEDWDYQPNASVQSEHFTLYFDESLFSLQEAQRFIAKKERLLVYITKYLQVDFNGTIEVRTIGRGSTFAYHSGNTQEARWYLLSDSGHEIVHIVAFKTLSYLSTTLFVEGLAEAACYDETGSAIQRFRDLTDRFPLDRPVGALYDPIRIQAISNRSDFSFFEYSRAGAFVEHCIETHGIERLKRFYRESYGIAESRRPDLFQECFGVPIDTAVIGFIHTVFPDKSADWIENNVN
jgi:hypothetical protein